MKMKLFAARSSSASS